MSEVAEWKLDVADQSSSSERSSASFLPVSCLPIGANLESSAKVPQVHGFSTADPLPFLLGCTHTAKVSPCTEVVQGMGLLLCLGKFSLF